MSARIYFRPWRIQTQHHGNEGGEEEVDIHYIGSSTMVLTVSRIQRAKERLIVEESQPRSAPGHSLGYAAYRMSCGQSRNGPGCWILKYHRLWRGRRRHCLRGYCGIAANDVQDRRRSMVRANQ
jgi:hypothetical protein